MKKPITKIKLELIVEGKTLLTLGGSCQKETPNMFTSITWDSYNTLPNINLKRDWLLNKSTTIKKYSLLISCVNKNYPGEPYEIKRSVRREK